MNFKISKFTTSLCLSMIAVLSTHFLWPNIALSQSLNSAQRNQMLIKADELYLADKVAEAEKLYRKAKPAFEGEKRGKADMDAISDPSELTGAAKIYWREANRGWDKELESATLIPLKMLVEKQPRFVPGHMLMIEAIKKFGDDSEETQEKVLAALETAASQFPESAELTKLQATMLADADKYLEASIAARQYSIMNPDSPDAAEFSQLAEKYFGKFQAQKNQQLLISGILGAAVNLATGQGLGQSVRVLPFLLQGESKVGEQSIQAYLSQRTVVQDPDIQNYINGVGQSLASLMGRKDFKFDFYVVKDPSLNAGAYPGGKIFINSGLLTAINSEAELAGIVGHEVAHAVLSHGYQNIVRGGLLNAIGRSVPAGNLLGLANLSYGRDQEKQSDMVATRALAAANYAADGTRNVMMAIAKNHKSRNPEYLGSHPLPNNRVRYLEQMIQQNGYNRYAFEGVDRYAKMKERLKTLA